MNTWFKKHREDVLHEQSVDAEQGLSDSEVKKRQASFGLNQLEAGKKINPLKLFLGQFKDVLVIILLVAAVVSWGVGLVGTGSDSPTYTLEEGREICTSFDFATDAELLGCANGATETEETATSAQTDKETSL